MKTKKKEYGLSPSQGDGLFPPTTLKPIFTPGHTDNNLMTSRCMYTIISAHNRPPAYTNEHELKTAPKMVRVIVCKP